MAIVRSHFRNGRLVDSHSRRVFRLRKSGNTNVVDIDFNKDKKPDLRVVAKPDKDRGTKATRNDLTGELTGRRVASGKSIDNRVVWRAVSQKPLQGLRSVRNPNEVKSRYRKGIILGRVPS